MKRSNLYKAIRDKGKIGMPYVAITDIQKGQFKNQSEHYPIPLPALLVEFQSASFSSLAHHNQLGKAKVSVYLYLDHVTDSFDTAKLEDSAIELLDKMDDVYQTLEGVTADSFGSLVRISEAITTYGQGYMSFRTDFEIGVKDLKIADTVAVKRPPIKIETLQA